MDELGSVAEWRSAGQAYFGSHLGRAARSPDETRFGAAVLDEGRSAGEGCSDSRPGHGPRSLSEAHFGAAVLDEERSAGEAYFDMRLRRGARSVGAHSHAALWSEAHDTRLVSGPCPAMGRNIGPRLMMSSRFDALTTA